MYGVGLVVFRRHRGDMVLGLARGRKNGWPKPGEMDEGIEVGLGAVCPFECGAVYTLFVRGRQGARWGVRGRMWRSVRECSSS